MKFINKVKCVETIGEPGLTAGKTYTLGEKIQDPAEYPGQVDMHTLDIIDDTGNVELHFGKFITDREAGLTCAKFEAVKG